MLNEQTEALSILPSQAEPHHGVSLGEAFRVWLRVASLSFGGPAGQIAVMHRILVEEKRWISESRFLHALNYCMLLPGPEAQQLATYIGWLMHRTLGGIMAGGLFVVPGIISIMALSYVYAGWGKVPIIVALFFGLKAAVLSIVLQAVFRIGKRALKNYVTITLAALAFMRILLFDIPFPIIVFGSALIGFVAGVSGLTAFLGDAGHTPSQVGGKPVVVDSLLGDELPAHARPTVARALSVSSIWLALWLVPTLAVFLLLGGSSVFSQIALFFTKMAAVTFGGAYAVLAASRADLWLAQAWRDARWSWYGRDDAGPAHHGPAVRGLHGRLSQPRHARADGGRYLGRTPGDLGHLHAVLSVDFPWRPVYRKVARQQGAEWRDVRHHGRRGRGGAQSLHLVRDPHSLPRDRTGSCLSVLVRCAAAGQY
jgi:putative chromate ion transporter